MALKVTLMFRIKIQGKRKYANAAWAGKKQTRLLPLYAEIDGKPVWHPEGVYVLRFELEGKRQWETVGKDPNQALDRLAERERALREASRGVLLDGTSAPTKTNLLLKDAITKYVATVAALKSSKTARAYKFILDQFTQSCSKTYVRHVDKQDLYAFAAWLREHGASDRTIHNKVGDIVTFLRASDIKDVTITYKYTEKKVKAYKESELKALFAACTDEEWLAFQFFLGTGFREQEVMHACYNDIDFEQKTITVRENRQLGFKPKDREERTVPVPDALLEMLQVRRDMRPNEWLIFPTTQGKTQGHFLRMLKERACTAGLNCGHCISRKNESCKDEPVCELWILHRFRKSFATFHHENGVSARKVQAWLGHSDLTTTLRYLADAELGSTKTRTQVNTSFAVFTRTEDD